MVVCGGTLGIFIACAMQVRGFRTIIVEKGVVKGRSQDWNISRAELLEFVEVGILDGKFSSSTDKSVFLAIRASMAMKSCRERCRRGCRNRVQPYARKILRLRRQGSCR